MICEPDRHLLCYNKENVIKLEDSEDNFLDKKSKPKNQNSERIEELKQILTGHNFTKFALLQGLSLPEKEKQKIIKDTFKNITAPINARNSANNT